MERRERGLDEGEVRGRAMGVVVELRLGLVFLLISKTMVGRTDGSNKEAEQGRGVPGGFRWRIVEDFALVSTTRTRVW